jgi:hypothetical protein
MSEPTQDDLLRQEILHMVYFLGKAVSEVTNARLSPSPRYPGWSDRGGRR